MKTVIGNKIVNTIFANKDAYSGLRGDKSNTWDWHWGSNQNQASYGFNLMMALSFNITHGYSVDQVKNQAENYLHYLLGRNTLSMVYLTSMGYYGGEHASYQLYHGWFSYTGNNGDAGNEKYNGKPDYIFEPFYPYIPSDNETSLFGPAPGLVVGGPNNSYSGTWEPPANAIAPAKAYRDFSKINWPNGKSWEITEPMMAYNGPFVGLCSFFMNKGKIIVQNISSAPLTVTNNKSQYIKFLVNAYSVLGNITNVSVNLSSIENNKILRLKLIRPNFYSNIYMINNTISTGKYIFPISISDSNNNIEIIYLTNFIVNYPVELDKEIVKICPNLINLSKNNYCNIFFKILQENSKVEIKVYTIFGKLINSILCKTYRNTNIIYKIKWNLKDKNIKIINPRLYILIIKIKEKKYIRKVLIN